MRKALCSPNERISASFDQGYILGVDRNKAEFLAAMESDKVSFQGASWLLKKNSVEILSHEYLSFIPVIICQKKF